MYQSQVEIPIQQNLYVQKSDNLIFSILTLIFCPVYICSITAIYFSLKARDNFNYGQNEQGKENAERAKDLSIAAIVFIVITVIFTVIYRIIEFFHSRINNIDIIIKFIYL